MQINTHNAKIKKPNALQEYLLPYFLGNQRFKICRETIIPSISSPCHPKQQLPIHKIIPQTASVSLLHDDLTNIRTSFSCLRMNYYTFVINNRGDSYPSHY
jgi:hypothetical protein